MYINTQEDKNNKSDKTTSQFIQPHMSCSAVMCFSAWGSEVVLREGEVFPLLFHSEHVSYRCCFFFPLWASGGLSIGFLKLHQRGNGGEKALLILRFV